MNNNTNILNSGLQAINGFLQNFFGRAKGDKGIWTIVFFLALAGIVMVYSTSTSLSVRRSTSTESYLIKQVLFMVIGIAIIYGVHLINYVVFTRLATILLILSILLLIYTLFFGTQINSGSRWVKIPGLGFTFQSSDLAKLSLYIYLSRIISKKQDVIKDFKKGFLHLIIPIGIVVLLILPANLSNACLVTITSIILLFIGRVSIKHLGLVILVGIVLISSLIGLAYYKNTHPDSFSVNSNSKLLKRVGTWVNRVETYMYGGKAENSDKFKDKMQQNIQANIAIAKGSWFGVGPGNSTQKNYLPHSYSDFIFAIIIEEWGFIGGSLVLFLYLLLLYRCIKIYNKTPFAFGAFLAIALSLSIVIQAIVHMLVNVNLLPNTGITLPFISMGGSSFLFSCISIGIILGIARNVEKIESTEAETTKILSESNEQNLD